MIPDATPCPETLLIVLRCCVLLQTVTRVVPADPGIPDSAEQSIPQAGQVRAEAGAVGRQPLRQGVLVLTCFGVTLPGAGSGANNVLAVVSMLLCLYVVCRCGSQILQTRLPSPLRSLTGRVCPCSSWPTGVVLQEGRGTCLMVSFR